MPSAVTSAGVFLILIVFGVSAKLNFTSGRVLSSTLAALLGGFLIFHYTTKHLSMKSYLGGSRYRGRSTREQRFASKNGGEVGGISNDGNTCFMNSVIQAIASSKELVKFVEDRAHFGGFTEALGQLLAGINGAYGSRGKEFSTRELLQKMPNGPKQNFFSGYSQEDAQEFYQLVFNLLEKEIKDRSGGNTKEKEGVDRDRTKYRNEIDHFVTGKESLGYLGPVYVPAEQVDPNRNDDPPKFMPLNLITPVDGITAERVGCLKCGENGGIRYSVNSGLSLNLPTRQVYSLELSQLLDEWMTPEIIEDVNCNRCGLEQTAEFLKEKMLKSEGKVLAMYETRLNEIETHLKRPNIPDEVFEKLSIKQMIKKTRKSKQIIMSRPPALLSLHINRSVFDPRSYQIVKNTSNVRFPEILDLEKYVADSDHINTDARLPLKKGTNFEVNNQDNEKLVESEPESGAESGAESESEPEPESEAKSEAQSEAKSEAKSESESEFEPKSQGINYQLKAVISHYGTHNYGHYICYRKWRGTWWRISDESVYVVTADEVINSQGTFMLFYEYDNGEQEELLQLSDESETEEIMESPSCGASGVENKSDMSDNDENSTSDVDEEGLDSKETNISVDALENGDDPEEYNSEEHRAFHI